MYQTKIYPLQTSWRSLLVIPGVLLVLLPVFLFSVYGVRSNIITEWVCPFSVVLGLVSLILFYALTNRLVTTQFGIENYFFYPFHVLIPWDKLIRIQMGPFGNVFLIAQPQSSPNSVLNTFSQTIQLDSYISDWQESDFIRDLRQYAPQASIPDEIFRKRKVRFPYRTGTFLLYFLACIMFMLVPTILVPKDIIQPIKFAWDFAVFGLLGGALGGMAELLQYSVWLSREPDEMAIKKVARLLYMTPFSAWMIVFFIGTVFHILTGYEVTKGMQGTANLASFWIGFVQFKILQRVFLNAKSMQSS
jgi:hypothetical protein